VKLCALAGGAVNQADADAIQLICVLSNGGRGLRGKARRSRMTSLEMWSGGRRGYVNGGDAEVGINQGILLR
jgi:hypothetical protein